MSERLQSSARVRIALLVLALIGCGANGCGASDRTATGTAGDGRGGGGSTTSAGAGGGGGPTGGAGGGLGGLFGPPGGFGGGSTAGASGSAGNGAGGQTMGGRGGVSPTGGAGGTAAPVVTCPSGTGNAISGPLIADFSATSSDGLPALQSSYRPYVLGGVMTDVRNGAWHIVGSATDVGATDGPNLGVGIDFGCIDASVYSGVSFTIDSSGSTCVGASTYLYDATGQRNHDTFDYDLFDVIGRIKTTVKIPFVFASEHHAVHSIEWVPDSSNFPCTFEWTIDDVTFYSNSGSGGNGSVSYYYGCPAGFDTTISGPVISDFSTGASDGFPILASSYRPYVLGSATTEVSNGVWHVAGNTPGYLDSVGPAIGAGITFPCIAPSTYSGLSFTIDTSGSTCTGIGVDLVNVHNTYLHRESIVGRTKTIVKIPATDLGTGMTEWTALKYIVLYPNDDHPCSFDWKIDDLGFYWDSGGGGAGGGGSSGAGGSGGGGATAGAGGAGSGG